MGNKDLRNRIRYTLHNLDNIDQIIQSLDADIKMIKNMSIEYCINSQLSDMPRSPTLTSSKVENAVIKRVDKIKALEEELLEIITMKMNIYKVLLMKLTAREKEVYNLRFRTGRITWEEIANRMKMSERQAKYDENKIISKLERVWNI